MTLPVIRNHLSSSTSTSSSFSVTAPTYASDDLMLAICGWVDPTGLNSIDIHVLSAGVPWTLRARSEGRRVPALTFPSAILYAYTFPAASLPSATVTVSQDGTSARRVHYAFFSIRNAKASAPVEADVGTSFVASPGATSLTWPSISLDGTAALVFNGAILTQESGGVSLPSGDAILSAWSNPSLDAFGVIEDEHYFPGANANEILAVAVGARTGASSGATTATSSIRRDTAQFTFAVTGGASGGWGPGFVGWD